MQRGKVRVYLQWRKETLTLDEKVCDASSLNSFQASLGLFLRINTASRYASSARDEILLPSISCRKRSRLLHREESSCLRAFHFPPRVRFRSGEAHRKKDSYAFQMLSSLVLTNLAKVQIIPMVAMWQFFCRLTSSRFSFVGSYISAALFTPVTS